MIRLRQEVVQLTRDVQRLSRFIGVQRTGFRKLLKKYKKWSHSSRLSEKFLPVLESPTSFTNQDFTSTFLELSLLYNVLRQAKLTSITVTPHVYPSNENLCMFDCQMITAITNSATFWIHPDNIVEAKITLLRNLSLISDNTAIKESPSISNLSTLNPTSPSHSGLETSENGKHSVRPEDLQPRVTDLTYTTFLDNVKKFHSIQTKSEPGRINSVYGANTASTPVLCSPVGGLRHFCIANLSSEQAEMIAKSKYEALNVTLNDMDNMSKVALSWVQKRLASPVSKMVSQKARFRYTDSVNAPPTDELLASSPNSQWDSPDIWATLDSNIRITKSGATEIKWPDKDPEDVVNFPYCVLDIRWKGLDKPAWVTELESSHLTYYVEGFSMYAHSVAVYYPNSLSVLPQWLKIINDEVDIRRAPKGRSGLTKRGNSKSSTNIALALQTPLTMSPGILLNNERQPLLRTTSARTLTQSQLNREDYGSNSDDAYASDLKNGSSGNQPVVRYWNEFDDPEDGPDEGIFVVIPDEDMEDVLFNGTDVAFLVSLGETIFAKAARLKLKIKRLLGLKPKRVKRRGLHTIHEEGEDDEDDDDDDTDHEGFYSPRFKSHRTNGIHLDMDGDYFSFPPAAVAEQRNSIITVFYSVCFFLSALMVCTLFGVILSEDMNSISYGTHVFIVSGFFVALGISVLAMSLFLMLADMPPWWHQTIVFTVFFSIICFGVGGVAWLLV